MYTESNERQRLFSNSLRVTEVFDADFISL